MVLGLIWFFISSVSCWGNLGIIFPRERERKGDFGTFFDGDPSKQILPVNWERSRSRLFSKDRSHSPRWKGRVSFVVVSSFSRSLSLSSSYSRSGCLPVFFFAFGKFSFFASFQWKTVVLVGLICLLFSFFSLQIHEEEKKLAASLYQWKTVVPLVAPLSRHSGYSSERLEGFSLFKVQIFLPFLFFSRFSQFCSPRLLLVERQWVLGSEMSSPSWNC